VGVRFVNEWFKIVKSSTPKIRNSEVNLIFVPNELIFASVEVNSALKDECPKFAFRATIKGFRSMGFVRDLRRLLFPLAQRKNCTGKIFVRDLWG
jgi:hypothetical protein